MDRVPLYTLGLQDWADRLIDSRPFVDRSEQSALLRRLRHETTELRHDFRALALRAFHFTLLPLREGHDHFEGLIALLAHKLIARHASSSFFLHGKPLLGGSLRVTNVRRAVIASKLDN